MINNSIQDSLLVGFNVIDDGNGLPIKAKLDLLSIKLQILCQGWYIIF